MLSNSFYVRTRLVFDGFFRIVDKANRTTSEYNCNPRTWKTKVWFHQSQKLKLRSDYSDNDEQTGWQKREGGRWWNERAQTLKLAIGISLVCFLQGPNSELGSVFPHGSLVSTITKPPSERIRMTSTWTSSPFPPKKMNTTRRGLTNELGLWN